MKKKSMAFEYNKSDTMLDEIGILLGVELSKQRPLHLRELIFELCLDKIMFSCLELVVGIAESAIDNLYNNE